MIDEERFLNIKTTTILKGFAAIMIIVSHLINSSYPKIFQIFRYGSFWVSIFYFFTGYGLIYSYKNKKDYLKKFWKSKFWKIYIPFIICQLLYFCVNVIIFKINYSIRDIILGVLGFKVFNTGLWYIQSLFIIYIIFYCIYKSKIKNKNKLICILYILYIMILIVLDKVIGIDTWWYLSTLCLILGFYIGEHKKKVIEVINHKKTKIFFIFNLVINILLLGMLYYATNNENNFLKINNSYFIVLCQLIISPILITNILYLTSLLKLKNIVLYKIGTFSMEVYFYHRIIINIIRDFLNINILLSFILSITLSIVLGYIMSNINKIIKRWGEKNES